MLSAGGAFQLFIAVALFVMAGALLAVGRRRPEGVLLAVFLALVAVNFAAITAFNATRDARWGQLAYLALALDPFYLLAFATLYPFERRPRRVLALLAGVGLASVAGAALVLLRPERIVLIATSSDALAPEHALLILNLVAAYAAAWALSFRVVRDAPTPQLAQRAVWLNVALGVAVVPRLGLVPEDLEFDLGRALLGLGELPIALGLARQALGATVPLALTLAVCALGFRLARREPSAGARAGLLGGMKLVLAVVVGLGLLRLGIAAWNVLGGPGFGQSIGYGARWLVFAAILVYGILAYEVVEFQRASERAVPVVGALLGGVAAALLVGGYAAGLGEGQATVVGLGASAGLAALVPGGFATRAAARRLERTAPSQRGVERRLELYRAALEAAWARGSPGSADRARLERDRRAFGVSYEEARALEHVVAATLAPQPPRLAPGDEPSAGLVLDELLGEGAHGRVFAARRFPSGEQVVVKEFRADRLGPDRARRQLLDEWRALQALEHPHIVRLLEVQAERGRYLLVMERVQGEPLSALLARGPLPEARVRALLADVLDALETAHARGVVHRDVKPGNVLVDRAGRAHVTDFGVATVDEDPEAVRATVSGLGHLGGFAGTLAYMAPEQVQRGSAGPAADLYAVGLVAFEALTGRPALDLRGCGLFDALDRVARPAVHLGVAPPAWRAWLAQALEPAPGARFPSAAAMRRALPGTADAGPAGAATPAAAVRRRPQAERT